MLNPSASSLPTHHSSPEPLATEPAEASTSKAFIARRNFATSQRLLWLLRCTQHQQQWDHLPHHRANCVARDGNNYIDSTFWQLQRTGYLFFRPDPMFKTYFSPKHMVTYLSVAYQYSMLAMVILPWNVNGFTVYFIYIQYNYRYTHIYNIYICIIYKYVL